MKLVFRFCMALLAMACLYTATPAAQAETIASKVHQLGQMDNIRVTGLRSARRSNLLFLEANFTNSSNSDDQFEYRIKWLDADGFSASNDEAWKPVTIHGQQQLSIQGIAPTPQATDFYIEVHSPHNTAYTPSASPQNATAH